jgi:hypothetical protein
MVPRKGLERTGNPLIWKTSIRLPRELPAIVAPGFAGFTRIALDSIPCLQPPEFLLPVAAAR